ncbi:MAG TPA: hypothetical protein VGC53_19670, partial [Vicinamibacteria bacterium]
SSERAHPAKTAPCFAQKAIQIPESGAASLPRPQVRSALVGTRSVLRAAASTLDEASADPRAGA